MASEEHLTRPAGRLSVIVPWPLPRASRATRIHEPGGRPHVLRRPRAHEATLSEVTGSGRIRQEGAEVGSSGAWS